VTNYSEHELVGRRVVGAINLGVRRIAGFESEFLLLGAVQPDGNVVLLDIDSSAELGSLVA
jgi:tRNA-binding protein